MSLEIVKMQLYWFNIIMIFLFLSIFGYLHIIFKIAFLIVWLFGVYSFIHVITILKGSRNNYKTILHADYLGVVHKETIME